MDTRGEWLFPLRVDEAYEFHEGPARVRVNNRWDYVDLNGRLLWGG
ncbi:MAG: WG repeat-containing protein [Thermoleophilia bacterium]